MSGSTGIRDKGLGSDVTATATEPPQAATDAHTGKKVVSSPPVVQAEDSVVRTGDRSANAGGQSATDAREALKPENLYQERTAGARSSAGPLANTTLPVGGQQTAAAGALSAGDPAAVGSGQQPAQPVQQAVTELEDPVAAASDAKAPAQGKEPGTFQKIFGVLKKVFQNPIFQGLLAVLCTLPGIGQIAAAVGACLGLLSCIGSFVSGEGMPWLTMGSTLLYIVGIFLPGLGAFGGLLGMWTPVYDKERGLTPASAKPESSEPKPESTSPSKPVSAESSATGLLPEEHAELLERVRLNADVMADEEKHQAWMDAVSELHRERARLEEEAASATSPLSPDSEARKNELDRLFRDELPGRAVAQIAETAYGVTEVTPTDVPTAGRFYVLREGETPESLGERMLGSTPPPRDLGAAIRAFNGFDQAEPPAAGTTVYIPSGDQLRSRPDNGWRDLVPMAAPDGAVRRPRIDALVDLLAGVDTDLTRRARSLAAVFDRMHVAPTKLAEPPPPEAEAVTRVGEESHPDA
jgi:hypothetical protein